MRPVARIGVVDAPQRGSVGVADEVIAADAFVARVGGVDEVGRAGLRRAVGFLDGDEIDPAVVLEAVPELVVDARLVPRVDDFPAFCRAVAYSKGLFKGTDKMQD
jgi:hypothetical protein